MEKLKQTDDFPEELIWSFWNEASQNQENKPTTTPSSQINK